MLSFEPGRVITPRRSRTYLIPLLLLAVLAASGGYSYAQFRRGGFDDLRGLRGEQGDPAELPPPQWRGAESAVPHFRAVRDKHGRIVAVMTHNTDVSDSWEREGDDPAFFQQFSPDGYALGINVVDIRNDPLTY